MIFKKHKKAAFELTLENIIGIVVAILIIIGTTYFFYRASSLFMPEPGQQSKANLRGLGAKISDLELNKADEVPFYLEGNYKLMGFSAYVPNSGEKSDWSALPMKCLRKSCLCVCENGECNDKSDYDCVTFEQMFVTVIDFESREGVQNIYLCKGNTTILISPAGFNYDTVNRFQEGLCKTGVM